MQCDKLKRITIKMYFLLFRFNKTICIFKVERNIHWNDIKRDYK